MGLRHRPIILRLLAERRSNEGLDLSALESLLASAGVEAVAEIAQARLSTGGGVLMRMENAVVLAGQSDWDTSAVQAVLSEIMAARLATATTKTNWTQRGGALVADGVTPVTIETRGNLLIVTNSESLHSAVARALDRVDYRAMDIGAGAVVFTRDGMAVTVNGIAQGGDAEEMARRSVELSVYDPDENAQMLQGLLIEVEEAYLHCPRALNFSSLWDTETIENNRREPPV